jgi:hypothetical protein
MPTRSGPTHSESESDTDAADKSSTARAEVAGTVEREGSGRAVAALGEFRLPLPGGLASEMDPKRLLWLGGLAALVAIEVIEWPVALAVGVGSYVAERLARERLREDLGQRS